MKAIVKYESGQNKVKLMDREIPQPSGREVRVKVQYSGICGTDIHILLDDGGYKTNPPVTLGHEFSGIVDEVGEGADPSLIGKRVVSETYYYTCGECFFCKTGRQNLCMDRKSIGSGVNGSMAEYVVVPQKNIHVIPDGVGLQEAALTEPLTCCVEAVLEKGGIIAGDRVLITGPGAIGLMCAQIAILCGGRVVMTGMKSDHDRLMLAKELGVESIAYVDEDDAQKKISGLLGEFGADVLFECSGSVSAIAMGLNLIRKGGRYIQVGLTGRMASIDMNLITLKEISVFGTFATKPVWWTRSIEMLEQKKIQLKPLISKVVPLDDWQEAFDLYHKGAGLKYLLKASEE